MKSNSMKHLFLYVLTLTLGICVCVGVVFYWLNGQQIIHQKIVASDPRNIDYQKILRSNRDKDLVELANKYLKQRDFITKNNYLLLKMNDLHYLINPNLIIDFTVTFNNHDRTSRKLKPIDIQNIRLGESLKVIGVTFLKESRQNLDLKDINLEIESLSSKFTLSLVEFEKKVIFSDEKSDVSNPRYDRYLPKEFPTQSSLCFSKKVTPFTKKDFVIDDIDKKINKLKKLSPRLDRMFGSFILKAETQNMLEMCYMIKLNEEMDYYTLKLNHSLLWPMADLRGIRE